MMTDFMGSNELEKQLRMEIMESIKKDNPERYAQWEEEQRIKELRKENARKQHASAGTDSGFGAAVLYIFVMIFGCVFVDFWIVWGAASLIYVLSKQKSNKR